MKILIKIFILFLLYCGNLFAEAETIKILVLPADLFSVCQNYYCFVEPSEIFANDINEKFNNSKKITSFDLYQVRDNASQNAQLKGYLINSLNKYKKFNQLDFDNLKKISQHFKTKFVLLISSSVNQNATKRNLWEVMEVSSAFEIYNNYKLYTSIVLVDGENGIVMWSSQYEKSLSDNQNRFWARNLASAISQSEKIKLYSKEILSSAVSESIVRRFYPKLSEDSAPTKTPKTNIMQFKPNAIENFSNQKDTDLGDIETETIFNF